jgi:hypothetical protein
VPAWATATTRKAWPSTEAKGSTLSDPDPGAKQGEIQGTKGAPRKRSFFVRRTCLGKKRAPTLGGKLGEMGVSHGECDGLRLFRKRRQIMPRWIIAATAALL